MRRYGVLLAAFGMASAQTPQRPSFDVVSVKRTPPERRNLLKFEKCPKGGAFVEEGAPPLWVIQFAYRLGDFDAFGAPAWLDSFDEAYDITGKSERKISGDDCRKMVQVLLEERFHLQMHHETRERSVYFLTVAGGAKIQRIEPDAPNEPGVRFNGRHLGILAEPVAPPGWSMARLAGYLADALEDRRPVVDKTNLPGLYSFDLEYSKDGVERPLLQQALERQLGLKLESAKAPMDVVVIDHVERPSDN